MSHLTLALACVALSLPALATPPGELKDHTRQDFNQYAEATTERVVRESQSTGPYLHLQHAARGDDGAIMSRLRAGELFYERLETRASDGEEIEIRDGLLHHWLGAVFISGAGVEEVLQFLQDYDHHAEVYPDVEESRLLRRDGDAYRAFLRFRKHKVITVVMNTEHEALYVRMAYDRAYSLSSSIRIQEVEDAGESSERELPEGEGRGFMWAMNSYWRFLERDGGTYVECESITLTRTIPFLLRWLVGPFVNDVPRQSLQSLLEITRSELETDR